MVHTALLTGKEKMRPTLTHRFNGKDGGVFVMKHEQKAVKIAIDIIIEMQVDLIIELGTFRGGFTKLLNEAIPNAEIHTFDLTNETRTVRKFFSGNVVFHNEDVLEKCLPLMQLLNRQEKKLLYCDNGKKRKEVAMYSWQLNALDYIGVHDWRHEIFPKDVDDYLIKWRQIERNRLAIAGSTSRFWLKPY
jgi:hypothetical protein